MKILIMSSSFSSYVIKDDEKQAIEIDNNNGFLDTLKKYLVKRGTMVIISGSPAKKHTDPTRITRQSFLMSGIPFEKYIYVDDTNKGNIDEYLKEADCVNLFGGHLYESNKFVNELGLKEKLKNFNGVIIGASAGAMNLAGTVYAKPENEDDFFPGFQKKLLGIGLTGVNIIPHYNILKDKVINGVSILNDIVVKDSDEFTFYLLPDYSYIVQTEKTIDMFGDIYLLENRIITKIN